MVAAAVSSSEKTSTRWNTAWWTFVLVAAGLLPLMVHASFDFGVTWDEKQRHHFGELVWEFLRGVRPRDSFVADGLHLYGGLFDTICAAVERYVPANRYVLRHGINAVFGWVGLVYAGRLASRLFGEWAGVLALVLLSASPRYFADSMNNPKDLPFAAATVAALYYFSTISPRWPYLSRSTSLKIVIALAAALNVRAGALFYFAYLWILVAAYTIEGRNFAWPRLADTVGRLVAVSALALLLGTVFWPWALGSPFIRPFEALLQLSHYPFAAAVLFDGRAVDTTHLPWDYAPWWFLISTPPVVLAGLLLSAAPDARERRLAKMALSGVIILPIALIIVDHSTLYDGVRHLLFLYPVLVVLAAGGWASMLSSYRPRWVRASAGVLLIGGIVNVAVFDVRSYPNEAVYFNELVGGTRGALARYDMDYWGNCLLEAVAWTATAAKQSGVPIVVSGEPYEIIQLDTERFHQLQFVLPNRGQNQIDILLAKGSAQNVAGLATRPDSLYRVQTHDGAVLCVVVPGPRFGELKGTLKLPPPGLSAHRLLSP